jgi:hypothetical protein
MLGDKPIGGDAVLAQCLCGARLILAHQPRISGHIGGENRGKSTGAGHS